MLDFDEEHWAQPCPQTERNRNCWCGLRYVSVPASLSDEMAPKNGAFSNAIVKYESTGEIWIYDSNGVPVKIKEGK